MGDLSRTSFKNFSQSIVEEEVVWKLWWRSRVRCWTGCLSNENENGMLITKNEKRDTETFCREMSSVKLPVPGMPYKTTNDTVQTTTRNDTLRETGQIQLCYAASAILYHVREPRFFKQGTTPRASLLHQLPDGILEGGPVYWSRERETRF